MHTPYTPPPTPPLQPPRAQRLALCVDSLSIPSPFPRTPIPHPGSTGPLEPWLSSCRAVEAPSRRCRGAVEARCRGAVEALSRPCLSSLSLSSYCRVPVEPVEPDSMRLGVEVCRGLSRSVEVCRGLSRSVEVCRAVEHVVLADATIKTRLLCTIYLAAPPAMSFKLYTCSPGGHVALLNLLLNRPRAGPALVCETLDVVVRM